METEENAHIDWIIASVLPDLECYFLVLPSDTVYLVGADGDYITTEKVPELYSEYIIGKYAARINSIIDKHHLSGYDSLDFFDSLRKPSPLKLQLNLWSSVLDRYKQAINTAKLLSKRFQVEVAIVETDAEYFSSATKQKMMNENIFFISNENPHHTSRFTEFLLECLSLRNKSLIDMANAKRFEKADETATKLSKVISEVNQEYRATHEGKDAPLNKIAEILTERNIESPGGSTKWYAKTVKRVLERSQVQR